MNVASALPSRADVRCRWRPYPAYRPAPVPWLASVPSQWNIKRLKYAVRLVNHKTEDSSGLPYIGLEHVESWTGRRIEPDIPVVPDGMSNVFASGDVLFGKLRPYLAKVLHAREPGVCTSEALVLRPRLLDPAFLTYWMLNRDLISVVDGSTYGSKMPRANWEFIGNLPTYVPPLDEQRAIAAFLDRETARIDALIAKKQRLIELLQEKRTALISHAVTKGLSPAVPMKPSGIDWLGDIPEHWKVISVRRLLRRIEQGWSPDADNRTASDDEWAVMRAGCVNSGQFDENDHKALPPGTEPPKTLEIRPGDFLMSRACGSADLVGSVAIVRDCRPRLILCDKLFRLHVRHDIADKELVAIALSSRFVRFQLEGQLSGAEGLARNISQSSIRNLVLCLPPLDEQTAIVASLRDRCGQLNRLCKAIEAGESRLSDYRSALISAAVTGTIDVREEATCPQ